MVIVLVAVVATNTMVMMAGQIFAGLLRTKFRRLGKFITKGNR